MTTIPRLIPSAGRETPPIVGEVVSGIEAVSRFIREQLARDTRNGQHTATFVSGYQGSPLGTLDQHLAAQPDFVDSADIRLQPGLNEELGATAVWGSQVEVPGATPTHDGVFGIWYGKGPGFDRSTDAIRHACMYGAHPRGGVVALVGDDPSAKSSTVPAASERSMAALSMPIFFPRNAEEIIAFGLYAIELSRRSGCWTAMKVVADVADGLWTVGRSFDDLQITVPDIKWDGRPWTYQQRVMQSPQASVLSETDLYGPRWEMVERFVDANDIDAIEIDPPQASVGIVAVGTAYDTVLEALRQLGVERAALADAGVRVLRIGMPYPVGADKVRRLAAGVHTVLVVEDKLSFVESQVRDILYPTADAPVVLGKKDTTGRRLVPADGQLTAARVTPAVRRVLGDFLTLSPPPPALLPIASLATQRVPYFCSGCPHNRSTGVPDGSLAAGGIGCHCLVTVSERDDSKVISLTQMGGEGSQWIGQAPFTSVDHIFQNLGDGTFFHSGQLAIQACVAAGVNITYKLLYNGVVAMTGAQHPEGQMSLLDVATKLRSEGVREVIICSDEPKRHRGTQLGAHVRVWDRTRLDEAQRLLREVQGVTVLVFDQHCAADARRLRKRGQLPERPTRLVINEAVCEGCGDCGVKSNCLSVQPVDTEFGRKTRVDQTSCNADYTCLEGECPAFTRVTLPTKAPRTQYPTPPDSPEPSRGWDGESYDIFMAGIGGTGVLTVNRVLAVAARAAGLHVEGLDQTGLSQKAGPVTSHLRLARDATARSNTIADHASDCILAFDLLTAVTDKNLAYGDPERTVAVASTSHTATGPMSYDASIAYPADATLVARLGAASSSITTLDAIGATGALFGTSLAANLLVVGAAYQLGAIPVPAPSIEAAIERNGVAVAMNLAAFRWGRASVSAPEAYATATASATRKTNRPSSTDDATARVAALVAGLRTEEPVRALAARRASYLLDYQSERIVRAYIGIVQCAADAERRVRPGHSEFSSVVARGAHKLAAYKDEYEVARLLTSDGAYDAVDQQVPGARNVTFMLHPPTLKAMGRQHKIGFGPRSHGALRLLARGKVVRGTPLDPFGYARLRRLERALVRHYTAMVRELASTLSNENYDRAVAAADAADLVRGYESVKLGNVARYLDRLTELDVDVMSLRRFLAD